MYHKFPKNSLPFFHFAPKKQFSEADIRPNGGNAFFITTTPDSEKKKQGGS